MASQTPAQRNQNREEHLKFGSGHFPATLYVLHQRSDSVGDSANLVEDDGRNAQKNCRENNNQEWEESSPFVRMIPTA
jgi:hypothetical protein